MVNVYLSGSDARNAAADLWQSDQLKRVNDQFAPPPADTAQPLPSAPVEAAGDQGSSLPSPPAAGPAMTQPAPPAAVPASAPAPVAAPNPTPDRNDIADHFTRNAIADAWEQNALADVTKGVSQAGAGVQSALADVPKEAQGLVSNMAALPGATPAPPAQPAPGAISGIPAPQPTQGQIATVAGGGGTDVEQYIRQSAAAHGIEPDTAVRVAQSEGGLTNPVRQSDYVDPSTGQREQSFGPFQLYLGGGLGNAALKAGIDPRDPNQWRQAVDFALDQAAKGGWSPWHGAARAGIGNFEGIGQAASSAGQAIASAAQTAGTAIGQAVGGSTRLDRTSQFQLGLNDADAYAACGPAAAIAFARAFGRNPTSQEALQLAKQSGWTQGGGMNGVVNEKKLMDAMGVPTTLETTVNWSKITSDAQNGNPVIVSTPGHYFTVDDAKQAQDGSTLYHVGTSGTDLRGGSEWMSAGEIQRRMGTANGALFADHPQASGPSLAEQAAGVVRSVAAPVQQKAQDLLSVVSNLAQPAQQTAQGIIGAVGNVGSAIGTTASNVGNAITNPNLPGQIYQNSPIGAFNTGLQQVGAAAGQIGSALGLQNPLDAAQTYTQIQQKYGGGLQPTPLGGMTWRPPDYSQMTPEDQAAMTNATMAIGGVIGEPGMPKLGGGAARGLPPNEALGPSGPQPGQLPLGTEFGQELPHGGPPPPAGGYEAPNVPQQGQLQLGSELPYGGQPPPAGGYQAPNVPQPGQLQLGSELPYGGPRPTGTEAPGPTGRQPGQMGLGIGEQYQQDLLAPSAGNFEPPNVPTPAQTPEQADYLRQAMTYRALTEGTPLPDIPYQGPTAQNLQGAVSGKPSPPTASMRLPGFPNPQTATPLELFRAYHTGNVVSSPATAVHVALNSVISPVWSLGTHSVADLLGGTLNAATGTPTGNLGRAVGRGSAVGSAMAEFGRNLAQGFSEFYANPSNVANKIDNPLASGLLKAQQAVGAALHSSFQNASQAATARLELAAEAGERAWNEGARGQDLMNRIGDLMTNPTPQMVARAQDVGTRAALRGSAGATQQVMQKIAEIPFIGNTLFPVVRIGAQSIAQGVEKSPLGLVGTGFDVARAAAGKGPYAGAGGFSQVGGAVTPLADRLTNNLAGTALTTFLTFKALDGTITGNGPDDPKARSMLQSQGWQPNSVLTPRGYMDYHALGPLAIPFSIAGNIGDSILYSKPQPGESGGDQVKAATLDLTRRVADYLASGTGMRTIGDMWNLIHGGVNAGAVGAQFAGSIAGGFVPLSAAVRAGVSSTDPFQRRAAAGNVQQIIQQELPGGTPLIGGRQDLPIRQDVLGRPEANPQQGIGAVLPRTGTGQPDPMLMLLSRAGIELPATAPKTISYSGRQIQLTPDEQQQRQTLFGQRLQQTLQGYLKSDKFQALPPDQQYKALEPVVRAASTYADQRLIGEMPAADRKVRMVSAPRAYGAGVVPYLAAGSNGGLVSLIARQSGAEADAAHQRLIAQYSSQPAQPQLAAVS